MATFTLPGVPSGPGQPTALRPAPGPLPSARFVFLAVSSLLLAVSAGAGQPLRGAAVETGRFDAPCLIKNRYTGKYLDLAVMAGNPDGAPIRGWELNRQKNQQWVLESVKAGQYRIRNLQSGKYLDNALVEGNPNGAKMHGWRLNHQTNQVWVLEWLGDGSYLYRLKNVGTGKYLDMASREGNPNGAAVHGWELNGQESQLWELADVPVTIKALALCFDPPVASRGGKRVSEIYKWYNPRQLAREYTEALRQCSGGYVQVQIVEWVDCDYFPVMEDGYQYAPDRYLRDWDARATHRPEAGSFRHLFSDKRVYHFNRQKTIPERVAAGEIDEVFTFAAPGTADYGEANMAGPSPFFINGAVKECPEARRNFAIMSFNYERDVGCMLENFCHRVECVMTRAYERHSRPKPVGKNNWERFSAYDKTSPGAAGCGNCHFAPSSETDYDWGNTRRVWSTCDDWLQNWPHLTGKRRMVDCSEWGSGDMARHHIWWLERLPKRPGVNPDGVQNNWWRYAIDFRQ